MVNLEIVFENKKCVIPCEENDFILNACERGIPILTTSE